MIALYQGTSFISRIIRFVSWSQYSHASWINIDKTTFKPTWEIEAWTKGGVQKVEKWGSNHTKGTRIDLFDFNAPLPAAEEATLVSFLEAEIGCGYDYRGVVSFVLHFMGESEGKWFCAELISAACHWIKRELLRVPDFKIDPGDIPKATVLHQCGTIYVGDDRWYGVDRVKVMELSGILRMA